MEKTKTKWELVIDKTNKFYASNAAIIVFMTLATSFSLLQIILFATGSMRVNGALITDDVNLMTLWLLLSASIIACFSGYIGAIMLFRGNSSFLYFQGGQTILYVITFLFSRIWMSAILNITIIFWLIIRYVAWKRNWIEKLNWNYKVITISTIVVFIIAFLIFFSFAYLLYENNLYVDELGKSKPIWVVIFDLLGSTLYFTASYLIIFKVRWAFVIYAIGKIFMITTLLQSGVVVSALQQAIYWSMDLTGFISWSIKKTS